MNLINIRLSLKKIKKFFTFHEFDDIIEFFWEVDDADDGSNDEAVHGLEDNAFPEIWEIELTDFEVVEDRDTKSLRDVEGEPEEGHEDGIGHSFEVFGAESGA